MNTNLAIQNTPKTTKAELIKLNAALATENANLRNKLNDVATPLVANNLQAQARNLARDLHVSTRIHNNTVEVFMHGGWNPASSIRSN